jgi:uncharacterized membrane protein YGL010W
MRSLTDQLAQYAAYHRDRRNIATHFVGIPLIVVALAILLSRPVWTPFAGSSAWLFPVSPAWLLFGVVTLYYLALDLSLGAAMAVFAAVCIVLGAWFARQPTALWLGSGIALFVIGWIFQFVGHAAYEHRKPAFVDDVIGLLIGPLFVLAEALFSGGWRPGLRAAIEAQAGPPRGERRETTAGHRAGRH